MNTAFRIRASRRSNPDAKARRIVIGCLLTAAAGFVILRLPAAGALIGALGIGVSPVLLYYAFAFLLGIAVGKAFPEIWAVAPLLAGGLDMTLFIHEAATSEVNIWPIGLALRLSWILAMYAGSALGYFGWIYFRRPQ
jgi:hypothetical protein